MLRYLFSSVIACLVAQAAQAHFVYLIASKDQSTLQVVLSDALEVDDAIDASKIAGTKLVLRGADGKDVPLTVKAQAHHLDVVLPGKGSRIVFGTTDYGVLQKGDAKPFKLQYHSKAVIGELTNATSTVGKALPVELVPSIKDGKVRFQFLAQGKPVGDVEVSVILPGETSKKAKTDKEGFTQWFEGKGRYGAWARHFEASAGESAGKKFDEVRHYATLVVDVNSK